MRASFRETHWLRALATLCAMIVGAFVLSACNIPPESVTQPCKEEEGREYRPPGICVPLHSCNAVSIAAGGAHSCAIVGPQTMCRSGDRIAPPDNNGACPAGASPITVGNELRCWGENSNGQLGDGTKTNRNSPTTVISPPPQPGEVAEVRQYLQVAAGTFHTCALLVGGAVECWGRNEFGRLGNGSMTDSTTPVAVTGLTGVVEIAAGGAHTCVRLTDGTVRCWGHNKGGQLGNGSTTNSSMPVAVTGLTGVVEIAAGGDFTCARLTGGTVRCWGDDEDGELGEYSTTRGVPMLTNVVQIAAGDTHVCARLTTGTVRCWGGSSLVRGGSSTTMDVPMLTDVVQIAADGAFTCARLTNGTVRCWGLRFVPSLSETGFRFNFEFNSMTPVTVEGLADVAEIAVGSIHGCARLLVTGEVRCWGNNQQGQLGNSTFEPSPTPTNRTLCCRGGQEACASGCANLQTDNANCGTCGYVCDAGMQCTAGRCMPATACSTCVYSACAAAANACVADGACRTWLTTYAACADEACRRATMNASTALATAVTTCQANQCRSACVGNRLAAGVVHTCAIRQNADNPSGAVVCWGQNDRQQLGVENAGRCEAAPGSDDAVEVVASQTFTCSRNAGGTVRCWGDPAPVLSVPNAVELVAGSRHVCARLSDGTVQCGGYAVTTYMNGELGSSDGRGPVSGLTGVVELAAGANPELLTWV